MRLGPISCCNPTYGAHFINADASLYTRAQRVTPNTEDKKDFLCDHGVNTRKTILLSSWR